jgi:hypothetical protein
MPTKSKPDFALIHTQLMNIMKKYESAILRPQNERMGNYELVRLPDEHSHGKTLWFGAVRIGKSYVSYHLMGVYAFPDLLEGISAELKKRMQGKSCFNFTKTDEKLFDELDELTNRSIMRFKKAKWPVWK